MELWIALAGVLTSALTWLAGKFKLSKTMVSMLVALVGWAVYYVATKYYPQTREMGVAFVMGVYGASQLVYNLVIKLTEKDSKSDTQKS